MMGSGHFLSQKQSLQQKLSPQQIQYIKLLQVPTLNLEQRIKDELELNPILEEMDSFDDRENVSDREMRDVQESNADKETDDKQVDDSNEVDWDEYLQGDDREAYKTSSGGGDDEDWRDLPKPYQESLLEELEHQVGLLSLNEREMLIADQVLGSIESDGYFRREVRSLIDGIAFNHGKLVTEEEVEKVLHKIQRLEPAGIAARNLRECLMIQLELMPKSSPGVAVAYKILRDEWEAFEKKHFDKIRNRLNLDDEDLKEAYECIQSLDPKPGATDSEMPDAHNYVVPDFEVYYKPILDAEGKEDPDQEGDFLINLHGRNFPKLRISPQYKKMWDDLKKQGKASSAEVKETQNFIKTKIEAAKWFIESIEQRQNTLMAVMQTIVALQTEFFKYGEGLKPMILKDIADRIGMDISTISRVVNGKYVQTNFGVFELKYFFNEGMESDSGEEVANRELKNLLAEIIGGENKSNPLSDQALVEEMKKKGFAIARRTVTKYREQLNIPVARLRKEL